MMYFLLTAPPWKSASCSIHNSQSKRRTKGLKLADEFFGIDGKSLHEQGGEEKEEKETERDRDMMLW